MALLEAIQLKIHEVRFYGGKSAVHYLAELIYQSNGGIFPRKLTITVFMEKFFLSKSQKNYIDDHGYSYFHGACMAGNEETVYRFISEGVNVNLDTWKCSPLHIAVQYRQVYVVAMLLDNGANPNQLNHEQSTPLHALSWLCVCECVTYYRFCDHREPVDDIVYMLVQKGANIEARNKYGDTPLQAAISCFDVELARTLMKHGAYLDSLNEDRMFNVDFSTIELKNYPLTLNIIETMQMLKSVGYEMSLRTRLRMIKYWTRLRGNDTEHLLPYGSWPSRANLNVMDIEKTLFIYPKFGFYIKQEAKDFLRERCEKMRPKHNGFQWTDEDFTLEAKHYAREVARLNEIMLTEDVSLYKLLQMNYSEGYSLLKNVNIWRVFQMHNLRCTDLNIKVKRHVANILIRLQLELFVADLFTTDHCNLNLPHTVCRIVAEKLSDEDLFRLCEQTDEDCLPTQQGQIYQNLIVVCANDSRRVKMCDYDIRTSNNL
ncbi:hypothetical protein TKK_0008545 [Trichogramma kaykai]